MSSDLNEQDGLQEEDPLDSSSSDWSGSGLVAGVIAILVSGWIWEFLVTAVCHGRSLDASASCFAAPFWPLAFLWAKYPSKVALLIAVPVTFGSVAAAYCLVDLWHDAQGAIALFMLLLPVPIATCISYGIGLALRGPKR